MEAVKIEVTMEKIEGAVALRKAVEDCIGKPQALFIYSFCAALDTTLQVAVQSGREAYDACSDQMTKVFLAWAVVQDKNQEHVEAILQSVLSSISKINLLLGQWAQSLYDAGADSRDAAELSNAETFYKFINARLDLTPEIAIVQGS